MKNVIFIENENWERSVEFVEHKEKSKKVKMAVSEEVFDILQNWKLKDAMEIINNVLDKKHKKHKKVIKNDMVFLDDGKFNS